MRKLQVMATNQQQSGGGGATARLSGIGSPTLGGGGGTPVKSCKKVLPPVAPEFVQRRNSQKMRQDSELSIHDAQQQSDTSAVNDNDVSLEERALDSGTGTEQSVLLLNHQQAVYYHQQLAIDALQVDVGGGGNINKLGPPPLPCRNSTLSVDSGRGASMLFVNGVQLPPPTAPPTNNGSLGSPAPSSSSSSISTISSNNMNVLKRNGGHSKSGGGAGMMGQLIGSSRDSSDNRCSSISSCSLGSVDRISTSTSMKTAEDSELISDWLYEINCPDYYLNLFLTAAYDLPTIARMNFEDLTAIGIRTPHEREFLIQHIKQLKTPDNLPNYVPSSIREFLRILNMEEYTEKMIEQNFHSVRDICKLIWDDLEDIGIVRLGHQKKILLAIKRIKDILNGKFVATPTQSQLSTSGGSTIKNGSIGYFSISSGSTASVSPSPPLHSANLQPMFNFQPELMAGSQCGCANGNKCPLCSGGPQFEFENELVPIQIHRSEMQSAIAEEGHYIPIGLNNPHQPHSISNNGNNNNGQQWAPTISMMNRNSMDEVDLIARKHQLNVQQQHEGYGAGHFMPQMRDDQELSYRPPSLAEINVLNGTLPRNFGGLLKEDKVRPVAKVQAQVVMRSQQHQQPMSSSLALKETPLNIVTYQSHQPLYVNFGQLNNHVHHHHHFYGAADVNADPNGSLKRNNNAINLVNTRAEVHHHQPSHPQTPVSSLMFTNSINCHSNIDKSTTSLESIDQIPFANENAGTIKQRGSMPATSMQGTSNDVYYQHHLRSLPKFQGGRSGGHQRTLSGGGDSSTGSDELAELEHMDSLRIEDDDDDIQVDSHGLTNNSGGVLLPTSHLESQGVAGVVPCEVSANVLNDIGNMLANLTDELDAMLEEEKRAGLNDD